MTRNQKLLEEFTAYCQANPEQRFWQALRNWSGADSIWWFDPAEDGDHGEGCDTFYWEGKNE